MSSASSSNSSDSVWAKTFGDFWGAFANEQLRINLPNRPENADSNANREDEKLKVLAVRKALSTAFGPVRQMFHEYQYVYGLLEWVLPAAGLTFNPKECIAGTTQLIQGYIVVDPIQIALSAMLAYFREEDYMHRLLPVAFNEEVSNKMTESFDDPSRAGFLRIYVFILLVKHFLPDIQSLDHQERNSHARGMSAVLDGAADAHYFYASQLHQDAHEFISFKNRFQTRPFVLRFKIPGNEYRRQDDAELSLLYPGTPKAKRESSEEERNISGASNLNNTRIARRRRN